MSAILDIECPLTRGERTLSAPIRNQSVVSTHVPSHSGEFSPRLGDVALVSRGVSFEFARKDRRGLTGENGSMGGGWTYTYDKRFELDGDHVVYCDGLGGPVASRRGVATDGSLPTASTHCSSAGTSTQRCVSGTATCSTCELGSLRDAAVRRSQGARCLEVDGVVGSATWGELAAGMPHVTVALSGRHLRGQAVPGDGPRWR
jgi:hypothetical protein